MRFKLALVGVIFTATLAVSFSASSASNQAPSPFFPLATAVQGQLGTVAVGQAVTYAITGTNRSTHTLPVAIIHLPPLPIASSSVPLATDPPMGPGARRLVVRNLKPNASISLTVTVKVPPLPPVQPGSPPVEVFCYPARGGVSLTETYAEPPPSLGEACSKLRSK